MRGFRVPDAIYEEARRYAAEAGETVSDVVRRSLDRYVKRERRKRQTGSSS
jgi:hypothetical protein